MDVRNIKIGDQFEAIIRKDPNPRWKGHKVRDAPFTVLHIHRYQNTPFNRTKYKNTSGGIHTITAEDSNLEHDGIPAIRTFKLSHFHISLLPKGCEHKRTHHKRVFSIIEKDNPDEDIPMDVEICKDCGMSRDVSDFMHSEWLMVDLDDPENFRQLGKLEKLAEGFGKNTQGHDFKCAIIDECATCSDKSKKNACDQCHEANQASPLNQW
jgi:hypothetical protein